MQRRRLLQTAGLTLVGLQFGFLGGCGGEAPPAARAAIDTALADPKAMGALRTLAGRLEGIDFVGPVCADQLQTADPLAALLARLREVDRDSASIGEALEARMQQDFADGDRLDIAGWQLGRTECLLLAAAAAEQGRSEPARSKQGELRFEDFAVIERWGPDATIEGEIFNPIGNGRGGFWIRVEEPVPGSTQLMLNGVLLATHFEPGVVTASLEPDYMDQVIANPGMYPLVMVDTARNVGQRVGYLTVRPKPPAALLADGSPSKVFCQVERWGPDHAPQGQAFNEQPDGSAAFWVRIGCAPSGAQLLLDGRPLPTSVSVGLVSARVAHYAELEIGDHRLALHDPESGETLTVGAFRIL